MEQESQDENDSNAWDLTDESDLQEIEQTVVNYGNTLREAINSGDFSLVQPYLSPNSNLYLIQLELVDDLFNNGTLETVYAFEMVSVNEISSIVYEVETFEEVEIDQSGVINLKQFKWIYTVGNLN